MRNILFALALAGASMTAVAATSDDKIFGEYRASCPGTFLRFKIGEEGVSNIRLNGKPYSKAETGEHGRFGWVGLYEFGIDDAVASRGVELMILFDQKENIAKVTAIYHELPGKGKASLKSCVLTFSLWPKNKGI
jgi:hypothetical protein